MTRGLPPPPPLSSLRSANRPGGQMIADLLSAAIDAERRLTVTAQDERDIAVLKTLRRAISQKWETEQ